MKKMFCYKSLPEVCTALHNTSMSSPSWCNISSTTNQSVLHIRVCLQVWWSTAAYVKKVVQSLSWLQRELPFFKNCPSWVWQCYSGALFCTCRLHTQSIPALGTLSLYCKPNNVRITECEWWHSLYKSDNYCTCSWFLTSLFALCTANSISYCVYHQVLHRHYSQNCQGEFRKAVGYRLKETITAGF